MAHTCGFDPQNLRGFLVQPQRPQTLPAAPKTLYCIHSLRSQQFLDLMTPRVQQVGQSLRTPLRIQPAGEIRPLRADPPGATARIALMAHVTAQSHQGHSPDRTGIGTQAMALATSAELRMPPAATMEARLRMPSSRRRWSTTAIAISMGMPT